MLQRVQDDDSLMGLLTSDLWGYNLCPFVTQLTHRFCGAHSRCLFLLGHVGVSFKHPERVGKPNRQAGEPGLKPTPAC